LDNDYVGVPELSLADMTRMFGDLLLFFESNESALKSGTIDWIEANRLVQSKAE